MTAPFLLDEMSEESACLAGRSTYDAPHVIPDFTESLCRRACCSCQRCVEGIEDIGLAVQVTRIEEIVSTTCAWHHRVSAMNVAAKDRQFERVRPRTDNNQPPYLVASQLECGSGQGIRS